MSFKILHTLLDKNSRVSIIKQGGSAKVRYSDSGTMSIQFPGSLQIYTSAKYTKQILVQDPRTSRSRWMSETKTLPLTVVIKTPDGKVFNADHITLNDLKRFRDLRGTTHGTWSYRIFGESESIAIIPDLTRVSAGKVHNTIQVQETIASKSAAPLINDTLNRAGTHRYEFDLYRVGKFTASSKISGSFFPLTIHNRLRLIDPDGTVVKTTTNDRLTYEVTLRELNKSRTASGNVRLWTLEVLTPSIPAPTFVIRVQATVIASYYVRTGVLHDRINFLLGDTGNKLSVYGEQKGSKLFARLRILDQATAETVDMLELLDAVIKSESQDPGVDANVEMGVAYVIASHTRDLGKGLKASMDGNFKISTIRITIGAGEKIQPAIPALKIELRTEGRFIVDFKGFPLATVKIRGNLIQLEAGLRLNADGTFSSATWINEDLIDLDVHWAAALAAGVLTGGLIALGLVGLSEYIEHKINETIQSGFSGFLSDAMSKVPRVLNMILGDEFTYQSLRLDGENIVFDYIAPLEPDPKPASNYQGVIGRTVTELGPGMFQVMPRTLGDTWENENLLNIEHIVVVMMENRSFDHVLGYRAMLPGHEDSDGLTSDLQTFLNDRGYPVPKLNESGIVPNRLNFKTRFPASVGHEFADVAEQLSEKITTPSGRPINSPKGFISNFTPKAKGHPELEVNDVLGYYEADDLPFFKFLAENYAYCERFFCSHPGPTLPNRMFSLAGDLQYDRTGEIILDNNNGDNFSLSRALTIYDLLTKKGIDWRVYESFPSVTMLRMFARYATDNTNIVNINRLQQDIAAGNLPPVTVVDPTMHHYPENDDHAPVADMYRGQLFLKGVYDALRSNNSLWRKTMLVITYDEHGGFYDHVIPPIADIRTPGIPPVLEAGLQPAVITTSDSASATGGFAWSSLKTGYGLRVPTFVVSPWTPAGKGPDITLDFCSILKTIIARFCAEDKPFISDRVHASNSFNAYLTETSPRMNVPPSPAMPLLPQEAQLQAGPRIITNLISRKLMRTGSVDYHDLSGMLARMLGR